MRTDTLAAVDARWARLFGVPAPRVWHGVSVAPHAALGDYPGWYVAWRGDGLHVSVPSTATAAEVEALRTEPRTSLATEVFWADFAHRRGLVLRGPARHAHLDVDPGPDPDVVDLDEADLSPVRAAVSDREWDDWVAEDPRHLVGLVDDGRVVAAASLGDWLGLGVDIGVVVVPDRRGRGLAGRVGRTCASYAIREHGHALWRAAHDNGASLRTVDRLGFTPYAVQLAVRPA